MFKASGTLIYSTNSRRFLLLLRNTSKKRTWGLAGGKCNAKENEFAAMIRECHEELGSLPNLLKIVPLHKFTSSDAKFEYITWFTAIADEFVPTLNQEHIGYCWVNQIQDLKPLHPGLQNLIKSTQINKKIYTLVSNIDTSCISFTYL